MISDLHIGDASPKDNLCQANREALLHSFLDYVEQQEGRLIILGDFFELLRYPLDAIVARRKELLDRLARLEATFVPGNHDEGTARLVDPNHPPHPFFARMSTAFTMPIGEKRFKFMHGHEVDPFISAPIRSVSRAVGAVACLFNSREGTCLLSNDAFTSVLMELGEQVLRLKDWANRCMGRALRECYYMMPPEEATRLTHQIRIQRMLSRYYQDKAEGLYDVAVVGHTHKAGAFGQWYLNSGSWTGVTNDFLRIAPDGQATVLTWGHSGPRVSPMKIPA